MRIVVLSESSESIRDSDLVGKDLSLLPTPLASYLTANKPFIIILDTYSPFVVISCLIVSHRPRQALPVPSAPRVSLLPHLNLCVFSHTPANVPLSTPYLRRISFVCHSYEKHRGCAPIIPILVHPERFPRRELARKELP